MKFKKYKVKLSVNLWDHICHDIHSSENLRDFVMHNLITYSGDLSKFYKIYSEVAGKTIVVKTELDIKTLEYYIKNIPVYCVYYNSPEYPMLNLPIPIHCIEDYKMFTKKISSFSKDKDISPEGLGQGKE